MHGVRRCVSCGDILLVTRLNLMIERSADTEGTNQLNKYLYVEQMAVLVAARSKAQV